MPTNNTNNNSSNFLTNLIFSRYLYNPIVIGTIILTISNILAKTIGFLFRIFLSRVFKNEGLGIIGLVMPISTLVYSISISGIQTAITRFVAANKDKNNILAYKYLFTGMYISVFLSCFVSFFIYKSASFISLNILKEYRCKPLLKITALSFPLASVHACINGFFYGFKKTKIPAISMLLEQLVRVGTVYILYTLSNNIRCAPSLSFICIGLLLGEFASASFSIIMLLIQSIKIPNIHIIPKQILFPSVSKDIISTSIPINLNKLCISLLATVETIMIPQLLVKNNTTLSQALSIYGIYSGISLPLIMFPSALTISASALLLPTISEAQSVKNTVKIRKTILITILCCILLGFFCFFVFYFFSNYIGVYIFKKPESVTQIRALSFICPFFYLSGILNSILHGLGKTGTTFIYYCVVSVLKIIIIYFLIPRIGFSGYIYAIILSQLLLDALFILALKQYIIYN